jgi:hypothetical protein
VDQQIQDQVLLEEEMEATPQLLVEQAHLFLHRQELYLREAEAEEIMFRLVEIGVEQMVVQEVVLELLLANLPLAALEILQIHRLLREMVVEMKFLLAEVAAAVLLQTV